MAARPTSRINLRAIPGEVALAPRAIQLGFRRSDAVSHRFNGLGVPLTVEVLTMMEVIGGVVLAAYAATFVGLALAERTKQ
jgi:hypothetical protein